MTRHSYRPFLLALGLACALLAPAAADNWPQWRGPTGDSLSRETNLPVKWSDTEGVLWKCPLPDDGASTPAVWGDALFVTAQDGDDLVLLKIARADGKVEWSRRVGSGTMRRGSPRRGEHTFHRLHNLASPSPITDGERVIVHFGTGDLAAYDFAGKQLWARNLQKDFGPYTIWWGHANSPVFWKDLVVSVCMQDSLADLRGKTAVDSYLVAHDKKTGEQKWKTLRHTDATSEECDAYTTPVFYQGKDRVEMLVMGANQLDSYDPATGKQFWYLPALKGGRTVTGPTVGHGLVYCTQGKMAAFLAVRIEGKDGKRGPESVAWKETKSTPDSPCPVLWKDWLFWITDTGFAECRDAKTGKQHWRERLAGDFKASPVVADGKVYFLNLKGTCTVVTAGPTFEKLAENRLGGGASASPAVADGRIYLRGSKALYCIGKP